MRSYDELFIGTEWVAPAGSGRLDVTSPATGEVVGQVAEATTADADRAVAAARRAFDEGPWPHLSMGERAAYLRKVGEALAPRGTELDELVPLESGIPICFFSGSSSFPLIDYYAGLAESYVLDEVRPGRAGVTGDGIVHRAPAGVVDDLALDIALPTVAQFGYFFNGEACAALTRVLAPRSRYDEVVERYCEIVAAYPVGDPLDPGTFVGPLIHEGQRAKVEAYIALGIEEGAKVALGGGRPAGLD